MKNKEKIDTSHLGCRSDRSKLVKVSIEGYTCHLIFLNKLKTALNLALVVSHSRTKGLLGIIGIEKKFSHAGTDGWSIGILSQPTLQLLYTDDLTEMKTSSILDL